MLSGAEDLVPVSGAGLRLSPVPAAERSRLCPDHARHRDGRRLLGGVVHRRAAQPLRHPPASRPPPAGPTPRSSPARPGRSSPGCSAETIDPLGNQISYSYQPDPAGTAQRYLSRVSYADYGDPASPALPGHRQDHPELRARPDPFSDHRPGFELRTTQRAAAIETWTQAGTVLARRVELRYADQAGLRPPTRCRC